jgi:hypothetical protein
VWVTEGTVEKHVRHILAKLNLPETDDDHPKRTALKRATVDDPLGSGLAACSAGDRLYANGRTAAHRAAGYLVYLALVGGVGLDFGYVLVAGMPASSTRPAAQPATGSTSRYGSLTWPGSSSSATRRRPPGPT